MNFIEKLYIGGEWCDSQSKKTIDVFNPASNKKIGTVPFAGKNDAQAAIDKASKAFKIWSKKTGKERSVVLKKLAKIMEIKLEELSKIIVIEQGKSIHEARNEVNYSISFVEWFAEEAKRIYGDIVPSLNNSQKLFTYKFPIGVIAAITPWNFPLAMVIRKVAPAIAAGCTVVLKPSEETPFTALAIAKLMEEAGIPKGVINIVCGDVQEIGDVFTSSLDVKLLSFTGSTAVGKMLMSKSAGTVKKVILELGGNAPFIVFEDADIEKAVEGLTASKIRNGGQSCICANRVFVHKNIAHSFIEKLKIKFSQIKIGDGLDEANNLGSMINEKAVEKISRLIEDAVSNGAEVVFEGKEAPSLGCFVKPTILVNKNLNSEIHDTEIFGPIVSIVTFDNEDEVIELANSTKYGLASYFYTEDRKRIWKMIEELDYGLVGVNDVVLSTEMASFGGVKESGIGREGGKSGIHEYLEDKFVSMI